ncbi:MAG: tetratricopeptide repeat protein, partial [Calditrichaeota bacterium]|nr:tetratricopeptide repeat protein [Calditrichota bacterium]
KITVEADWTGIAKTFIDPAVNHRIGLGMDSVGEIRRVSVIFISFSGLDYDNDKKVGDKLAELYAWLYSVTTKYDGSINKVDMGDKGSKLIITFGTPTAHENDEELAIYCGLELVGGLDRMKQLGISLKMGIATGSVFAGEVGSPERQEYTIMGSVVNLSARIMSNSLKGQLLTDSATYERVKDIFDFAEPKYVQFKGMSEPMPVYRARGLKGESTQKREITKLPLVGRKQELAEALKVIDKAKQSKLQVLIVRGDTGTGKSRLAEELVETISKSDFKIAGGEALSYAIKSPYFIWISTLRKLMGLPGTGGSPEVLEKLVKVIEEADPENTFRLPIIAGLLGIKCEENDVTKHFDGQLRQENLFDFVVQYMKFLTETKPVSIVIEDAQWIDRNSLGLMAYLMRNLADFPVLFIYIRRPYNKLFKSPYIGAIEGHETTTAITVTELSIEETEKLIVQKYKATAIDDELMKFVFDSSHGNASFVEQLFDKLLSTKVIKFMPDEKGTGVYIDKEGNLSEVEVPDSLNSLIMSKLDSLNPQSKLTVNVAAAIGRQFQVDIIKGSYPTDLDDNLIIDSMEELDSREILVQSGEEEIYDYIFKNLLTQEVAYNSLLFSHRREYHKRIGFCLETIYCDSLSDWYDELARHYQQTDEDSKAINYLKKAGDKAFDIYANEYARSCYSRALKRASSEDYPQERFRLLNMREKVLTFLGRLDDRKKDLDELLELGYRTSDKKGIVSVLFSLSGYYQRSHELDKMKKVIDKANEILKTIDFPFGQININSSAGDWFYLQNKVVEALEKWTISESEAERIGDDIGLSAVLISIGVAHKALGNYEKAFESYHKSVEIGRKIGNKKFEAISLGNIGVLHHIRGDLDKALEAYTQALEIAKSIGSKQTQTLYLGNVATIYKRKGEKDRALKSYQDLYALTVQMGYHRGTVLALSNMGSWYQDNGEFEMAFTQYDQALEIANKYNFKDRIAMIMINGGLVFHYQNKLEKAKTTLEKAIEKSIEVKSKPMEDYARRYLGFVLIDLDQGDGAKKQFELACEIAESAGSKTSCASCKIGFGLIEMIDGK